MNLSFHLLQFLKKNGTAIIPGFGVFELKNTVAAISENDKILPPSKKIIFHQDFSVSNPDFVTYLSHSENISEFEAELQLKTLTNRWKSSLETDQDLELEKIGTFHVFENKIQLEGEKIQEQIPDFYGLEEIKLSDLHSVQTAETKEVAYQFNNSILWLFLILIPILGLCYLGFTNQELLFGKKSDLSIKNSTHRIETPKKPTVVKPAIEKDSTTSASTPQPIQ